MGGKFLLFKMKNKKSQIPTTLTWFVAFIIILFITASIIIAGKKEMPVLGSGEGNIGVVQYGFEDLELNRNLIKLLNTPVEFEGEKIRISKLIVKWDLSEGDERKNIENILEQTINQELSEYYFTIHRNDPGVFLAFENNPIKVSRINDFKFSLIYLVSEKGMLKVSLSFSKYDTIPI